MSGGRELILTGGDDGIARVFDPEREDKEPVVEFDDGQDVPVTAVAWSSDGNQCFVGGVDNAIKVWDLRKNEIVYTLRGHTDTVSIPSCRDAADSQISSLSLSPSGHFLASYGLDSTILIHDVRPFSADPLRIHRTLHGAPAGFEQVLSKCAWSKSDGGARVAVGGGDRAVTIWDVETGRILYKLPGHKGTVTCCDFHPR